MLSRVTSHFLRIERFFIETSPKAISLSQKLLPREIEKGCSLTWIWRQSWTVCRVERVTGLALYSLWRLRCFKEKATHAGHDLEPFFYVFTWVYIRYGYEGIEETSGSRWLRATKTRK